MRVLLAIVVAAICFASATGCSRKEAPSAASKAKVSATGAFEFYFGRPPAISKGTCYAFVIYYPSATDASKVVPFPFFTDDQRVMKRVAIERLIAGVDKSYGEEILQLFPLGTKLVSLTDRSGEVTAEFSGDIVPVAASPDNGHALYNAIALTLKQFPEVRSVTVKSQGRVVFPGSASQSGEMFAVAQPSAPRLLQLSATRDPAAPYISEVNAFFDRPVEIKQCRFETIDEVPIEGELSRSSLDMAGVLKPRDPSQIVEGSTIRVRWEVVDNAGRSASGEDVFPLQVKVQGAR